MIPWPLLVLAVAGEPRVDVGSGLVPPAVYAREARAAIRDQSSLWEEATRAPPAWPAIIHLEADDRLKPGQAGISELGRVGLRATAVTGLDQAGVIALRHEMAHQLLLRSCPASSRDRLFHEAVALAFSGELDAWSSGGYLSLSAALSKLEAGADLDAKPGRRALARVIANARLRGRISAALADRLVRCADGSAWHSLTLEELAGPPLQVGDALVVVSRHSGEILELQGAAEVPVPFGSTLKPFLVAGAGVAAAPSLPVRAQTPEWECGAAPGQLMDVGTALLRSCNGYFLDWAQRSPGVVRFGGYGPLLAALGMGALPADGSEAIGIRPTLMVTPLAVAQAYRVLAEANPDVVAILRRNASSGTLAGLESSDELTGVALKTGTVRTGDSAPALGWIVAIDPDHVMVEVRQGLMPRSFAGDVAVRLQHWRGRGEDGAAAVQILGLVSSAEVTAACEGVAVSLTDRGPRLIATRSFESLERDLLAGPMLCLGQPWRVRFPGSEPEGRSYAGILSCSPPRALRSTDPWASLGNRRARVGSAFQLRTRMASYASGVADSEDASLVGEPRGALLAAIVTNALHSRHAPRPVCDTTHCQVFRGTSTPRPGDAEAVEAALSGSAQDPAGWFPFAQGGDQPWSETRSLDQVSRVAGGPLVGLSFQGLQVTTVVRRADGDAVFDDQGVLPCEALRGPLKLPSCPDRAVVESGRVRFEGRGRGHGEGLQLESLKQSERLREDMLLEARRAQR